VSRNVQGDLSAGHQLMGSSVVGVDLRRSDVELATLAVSDVVQALGL